MLRHQAGEGRKVSVVADCTDRCSIEWGFRRITRVYGALSDNFSLLVMKRYLSSRRVIALDKIRVTSSGRRSLPPNS